MKRLRGKLTYANVMATIAVFIALGGASYAATQLPKNSVGAKQLKKDAVTAAKIKNRAVTGAKIKASSLGTVPRAERATTADIAAQAANASALGGASPNSYLRSDRIIFGTGDPTTSTPQTLLVASGIEITTVASAGSVFKVRFVNKNSTQWEVSNSYGTNVNTLAPGSTVAAEPTGSRTATFVARNIANPQQAVVLYCGADFSPYILDCFALMSPSA